MFCKNYSPLIKISSGTNVDKNFLYNKSPMPHLGDPQLPFDDIQKPDTLKPIFHRLRAETKKGSSCIVPAP